MKTKTEEISPLVMYPNGILRQKCEPITSFNEDLKIFCQQLSILCNRYEGLGLSAPQVGKTVRVIAINVEHCPLVTEFGFVPGDCSPTPEKKEYKRKRHAHLINPKIINACSKTHKLKEGCLSLPGIFAKIPRPTSFDVEFQDVKGNTCIEHIEDTAQDIYGIIVQHEIDHLDGVLMIDKIEEFDKSKLINKINKLRRR